MEPKPVERMRDWIEPVHPSIVKLHDDLIAIYKLLREKQGDIDDAFDRVSRKIGYVVTTTLPVVLEVGEKDKKGKVTMGAEHLKDTFFDEEVSKVMSGLPITGISPGRYSLYVLWYGALKLKLHTDWMEPAHFHWMEPAHYIQDRLAAAVQAGAASRVRPEVREPAHWFNPAWALTIEEAVLINAIDEVYPELRLGPQIAAYRQMQRGIVPPEVQEPAHLQITQPGRHMST